MEAIVAGALMAIGEYSAGKGADHVLGKFAVKRAVRRIIKEDKKYIHQIFAGQEKKERQEVEEFLLNRVFQDPEFLYPGMEMPWEKQNSLAVKYATFLAGHEENKPRYSATDETVQKMALCVNFHNRHVHQYLLSNSEKIAIKEISDKIDALGYAGRTLDADGEYLAKNRELEYAHLQLDSIIHALRMDLRFYRLILLIGMIGILVLVPVTVFQFSRFSHETAPTIWVMYPLIFVVIALFLLTVANWLKIMGCERKIARYSGQLWELNFEIYKMNLLCERNNSEEPSGEASTSITQLND